jgi:hypothetical protein
VLPLDQSRPVQAVTAGVGTTVGSTVGVALGPGVKEVLDGRVVGEPDGLEEQLDRMRAPAAISAAGVAILSRIMLPSPVALWTGYLVIAFRNQ